MSGVDVFISYKSERRAAARHLAKVLEGHGFSVWYDYGLIPGEDFEPRLMTELANARVCVVLWCALAVGSAWVAREARAARAEGRYLPCWIQKAALPGEFAGADTIDLTGWDGAPRSHALDRLLEHVGRKVGREPAPQFAALRDLDESWRSFGAPRLAAFGLSAPPTAMAEDEAAAPALASPDVTGSSATPAPSPPPPPTTAAAPAAARPARRTETWIPVHAFQAVPGEVQTVAWSPDGTRVAAEGTDSSNVTIWDAIEGRGVATFPGPNDEARPNCLAWSPDGALVAAGYEARLYIVDAATGDERQVLKVFGAHLVAAAFDETGDHVVSANLDKTIALWARADGALVAQINASGWGDVAALRAVLAARPMRIEADYDTLEQRCWFAASSDASGPWTADAQPHDRLWPLTAQAALAAREHNTALVLYAVDSGEPIERYSTDRFKLATLRTSEAGRFMMIVEGAKLRLWSAEDGRELATLSPPGGAWVRAAEFSPDGTMIATGDSRGAVRVWRRDA